MSIHTTLYLAHRPQNFEDIEAQDHIKETLKNAVRLQKIAHAYLFSGPRGTGKTSTARILAKAITCENLQADGNPCTQCKTCKSIEEGFMVDVIEIDAASHRSIDDVRDLREKVRFAPTLAPFKVYIIDEVHMLTKDAFNALLKTLEEPPQHVYFILATTELHKVLPTIQSRCQTFQFYPLTQEEIISRLVKVCEKEHIAYDKDALEIIAQEAAGGMRDALSLLEKVAFQAKHLTRTLVERLLGKGQETHFEKLFRAIESSSAAPIIEYLSLIEQQGLHMETFMKGFVLFLRKQLLSFAVGKQYDPQRILFFTRLITHIEEALFELKTSFLPLLPFEIHLLAFQAESIPASIPLSPTTSAQHVTKEKAPISPSTPIEQPSEQKNSTSSSPYAETTSAQSSPEVKEESIEEHEPVSNDSTASPNAPTLPLSTLKRDWEKITGSIEKSMLRLTFGKHSFPRTLQDTQLTIAVFGPFHMKKAEENKATLQKALLSTTGIDFHVILIEEPVSNTPKSAPSSTKPSTTEPDDIAAFMGGTVL